MATNIGNCECGNAPKTAQIFICKTPMPARSCGWRVYCEDCRILGPIRTRRIRAVDSWNQGRRLPMLDDGEDPFTVVAPNQLTDKIAIPGKELDGASEAEVTAEVLDALAGAGFGHLKNGEETYEPAWYLRNEGTSHGNTSGQPDLWIRKHDWPTGVWCGIELKARTRDAHLKPNQLVLAGALGIYVCWNADMVLEAIQCTDKKVLK